MKIKWPLLKGGKAIGKFSVAMGWIAHPNFSVPLAAPMKNSQICTFFYEYSCDLSPLYIPAAWHRETILCATVWDNVLENYHHSKSDVTQGNLVEQVVLCENLVLSCQSFMNY